eukprot:scaffold114603_cov51-Phaeocystis_antarctica.AAC.2
MKSSSSSSSSMPSFCGSSFASPPAAWPMGIRLSGRSSSGEGSPSTVTQYRPRAASYAVTSPHLPLSSGRPASPSTRTRRPTSAAAAPPASATSSGCGSSLTGL